MVSRHLVEQPGLIQSKSVFFCPHFSVWSRQSILYFVSPERCNEQKLLLSCVSCLCLDLQRSQAQQCLPSSDLPLHFTEATRAVLVDWLIQVHVSPSFRYISTVPPAWSRTSRLPQVF